MCFTAFCVSYVPEQGTVGASGDLAPLAHLALGLIGEGKMWSPTTGWDDASVVLEKNHLQVAINPDFCLYQYYTDYSCLDVLDVA